MISRSLIAASVMLALATGGAFAQAAAPASPPAASSAPAGKMMTKKPRTAQSIECSSKADQQGLHGKPRKHFMKSCKSGKA